MQSNRDTGLALVVAAAASLASRNDKHGCSYCEGMSVWGAIGKDNGANVAADKFKGPWGVIRNDKRACSYCEDMSESVWGAIGKDNGANVAGDKSKSINKCSQPEQRKYLRAELSRTIEFMCGQEVFAKMLAATRAEGAVRAAAPVAVADPITEEGEAVARVMRFGIESERDATDVSDLDGEARAAK